MSVSTEFLSYPGLPWLSVSRDVHKFEVWVTVRFNDYIDAFIMSEDAIGENGSLLIKEAYLRRARLIAVARIAEGLEK
jgi:hypothetical protein